MNRVYYNTSVHRSC